MCGHTDRLVDDIVFVQAHAPYTSAAAVLHTVGIGGDPLDISVLGYRDDDIFDRDQVFVFHVCPGIDDLTASLITVFILDLGQFILQDLFNTCMVGQDILQVCDFDQQFLVFVFDLFSFQSGQSSQLHGQDRLALDLIQSESFRKLAEDLVVITG